MRYNTRDFVDVESMNIGIVNNINKCVMKNDILIFLGDWSFGGFDNIKTFYDRLICKNIHLVLGNHDHHIQNDKDNIKSLFLSVQQYLFLEIDKNRFILMHYPISSWNGLDNGVIHLHGHICTLWEINDSARVNVWMLEWTDTQSSDLII